MFKRSILFIAVALFALPAFAQQTTGQSDVQLAADGVANLATVECFTASSTNQICTQPVIPTPAGP